MSGTYQHVVEAGKKVRFTAIVLGAKYTQKLEIHADSGFNKEYPLTQADGVKRLTYDEANPLPKDTVFTFTGWHDDGGRSSSWTISDGPRHWIEGERDGGKAYVVVMRWNDSGHDHDYNDLECKLWVNR